MAAKKIDKVTFRCCLSFELDSWKVKGIKNHNKYVSRYTDYDKRSKLIT